MTARLQTFVLDTAQPRALAEFYAAVLDLPVAREDSDGWVVVGNEDALPTLSFQLAPDHVPPQWPDPGHPQQAHLDLLVDDLDAEEARIVDLGAVPLLEDDGFRVYADPAGHPFCLVKG